jgi:hypothetical protein
MRALMASAFDTAFFCLSLPAEGSGDLPPSSALPSVWFKRLGDFYE